MQNIKLLLALFAGNLDNSASEGGTEERIINGIAYLRFFFFQNFLSLTNKLIDRIVEFIF